MTVIQIVSLLLVCGLSLVVPLLWLIGAIAVTLAVIVTRASPSAPREDRAVAVARFATTIASLTEEIRASTRVASEMRAEVIALTKSKTGAPAVRPAPLDSSAEPAQPVAHASQTPLESVRSGPTSPSDWARTEPNGMRVHPGSSSGGRIPPPTPPDALRGAASLPPLQAAGLPVTSTSNGVPPLLYDPTLPIAGMSSPAAKRS